MKTARFVTVLLAVTACAGGIVMAVAEPEQQAGSRPASKQGWSNITKCIPGKNDCRVETEPAVDASTPPLDGNYHPCAFAGLLTKPLVLLSAVTTSPIDDVPRSAQINTSLGCGPDGTAGVLPITTPKCTITATRTSQVNTANAGDTVCFSGDNLAGSRLLITTSGTPEAPIVVTGDGGTVVKGIRVNADNVIVQGFNVLDASAPGVQLKGNNLTLQDTYIDHPTGGDYDGIRYFGDGIKILHNRVTNITNTGGAHADCMQTFATTTPTSHSVLISGNRCEKIDNQCLIAQGPNSKAGNGSRRGESSGLTFTNNYCDAHASQAVQIDDTQNVTITNNDIQGKVSKAFNIVNDSTGANVGCNTIGTGVRTAMIMDTSSRSGE